MFIDCCDLRSLVAHLTHSGDLCAATLWFARNAAKKIESSTKSLTEETHPHMIIKLSKCLLSYVYYRDIRRGPRSWFELRLHERHKVFFQNESNAHEVERYGDIKLKYNKNANSRTLNIVDVYYLLISIINVRLKHRAEAEAGTEFLVPHFASLWCSSGGSELCC